MKPPDGQFTVTGWVPVYVDVTVEDGKVTDVRAVRASDTEFRYGDPRIDRNNSNHEPRRSWDAKVVTDDGKPVGSQDGLRIQWALEDAQGIAWPAWSWA